MGPETPSVPIINELIYVADVARTYMFFLFQGSGVVKAGFAGDQIPKYCFPN